MAAAAAFASVSALTIASTISQRDAILAQGSIEESRARTDARNARIQAADAKRRGDKRAAAVRGKQTQLSGTQRAILSAQGIDPTSGSGAAIITESRFFGDLDILEAKNNARLEAFGFEAQALSSEGRARFARLTSKAAARQTVLTGAAQIARDLSFFGLSAAKTTNARKRFTPRNPTEARFSKQFKRTGSTAGGDFSPGQVKF